MSDYSWNADVDGHRHVITVQTDSETGRSAIRVDGRIAAKPMASTDLEREVPVGSSQYVVRRLEDGTFDLDLAPIVFQEQPVVEQVAGRPGQQGGKPLEEKSSVLKWVIAIVVLIAAVVFGRTGWLFLQYARVPWTPYNAADATFKIKFAGAPEEETKTRTLNGDVWQLVTLTSGYKNHFYGLEYTDVQRVVTAMGAPALIDDYFTRWAASLNATVVSKEETTLAENPAIRFQLTIPSATEGGKPSIAPGIVAIRNKRVFFVWAVAPEGDKSMPDLRSFVSSFQLPPPPAPTLKL